MSLLTPIPLSSWVSAVVFGMALASAAPVKAGFFDFIIVTSNEDSFHRLSKKDAPGYEEAGNKWGERHRNQKAVPGTVTDGLFVKALIDSTEGGLDFFWIHADLKEAFKKGYRMGYQDRTADLVLGPYLTEAAAMIGGNSASNFVEVVNRFETDWAKGLGRAVNVFVTLISEGSQADRERFIKEFEFYYGKKYQKTQADLREGGFVTQTSEGGTTLFLDARKTVAVLNIPSTTTLKTEIYRQTFKVMGDEWGKRFSHNLMRRDELIDILRRSKTALQEVEPRLAGNPGHRARRLRQHLWHGCRKRLLGLGQGSGLRGIRVGSAGGDGDTAGESYRGGIYAAAQTEVGADKTFDQGCCLVGEEPHTPPQAPRWTTTH